MVLHDVPHALFTISHVVSIHSSSPIPVRLPLAAGFEGHCFTSTAAFTVVDAYNDPRFAPSADKALVSHGLQILIRPRT